MCGVDSTLSAHRKLRAVRQVWKTKRAICCVSETISVPLVHLLLHISCNLYIKFHEEVQQTLPYPFKL
jgi:hypothetical protein